MNYITRHITKATSLFTIAVGCLVLAGWLLNIPALISISPGWASMKFNTALCFVLSGIGLYLLHTASGKTRRKSIGLICASIVFLTGLLSISQYIFSYSAGIDEFFCKEGNPTRAITFPGRMSELTAISFVLLGFVLLVLKKKKYPWLIQTLLFVVVPFSMGTIFIYFFSAGFLSNIPLLTSTALHTAILFIVLSAGVIYSTPLQNTGLSFQKKITGFFILIALLLGMMFYTYAKNQEKERSTTQLLDHTNKVLFKAETLKALMNQIQSTIRGYIITGRDQDVQLFGIEADSIHSIIKDIRIMTNDNTSQQLRIDTLQKLIDRYFAFMSNEIAVRRNEGFEAAQKILLTRQSTQLIIEAQSRADALVQEENQLLAKRKAENELSLQNAGKIITLFQWVIFLLSLSALIIILNNTRRRNKAEAQMKEYQYFFNNNNDLCGIANSTGYFDAINANFIKTLGYSEKEFYATPFIDLIHPDDVASTLEIYGQLKSGALVINFVNRYRKKDGGYLYLDWNATPNAATGKLYCVARDITERREAQEKILHMSNRLTLATRSGGVGIWDWDIVNNKMEWDDQMYRLYGITPETFGGAYEAWEQGLHPEDVERGNEEIQQALRGEKEFDTEFRVKWPDSSVHYIRAIGNIERDASGNPLRMIGTNWDITEIKQSEEKFRSLINFSPLGIAVTNMQGIIQEANPAILNMMGFASKEEFMATPAVEYYADKNDREKILNLVKTNGYVRNFELRIKRKDREDVWLSHHMISFKWANNETMLLSAVLDITEIKKTEDSLRNSLKEVSDYKYALDESSIVAITDQKGIIQQVNDNFCKISKYTREELIGQDHRIMNSGFHPSAFIRDMWETISNGKVWHGEVKNKAKDGTYYWLDSTIVPFMNEHGEAYQYLAIRFNITKRKILEDEINKFNRELEQKVKERTTELFKSQQQYKNLLAKMKEGFMVDDMEGKITFANEEYLKIFGFAEDDVTNLRLEDYVAPEYHEILRSRHNRRVAGETVPDVFEYEGIRKNGKRIWVEVRVNPVIENGITIGTQSLIRDITELKKAEEALKESENYLRTILQTDPECVKVLNRKGELMSMNAAGLAMIEADQEEQVVGHAMTDLLHKKYQAGFNQLTKDIFNGKSGTFEFEITGLKGSHRWLETHAAPLRNKEGQITSLLGVTRDVTERKKAEEKIKEYTEELKTSNTELERFAYVASHDLQEPLRMVSSFLTLLEKRIDSQLDDTSKQYINFAVDGAGRMKTLIQDLLLYSRIGANKEEFAPIDINEIMQYTIKVLDENIVKMGAQIIVKPLPVIVANKTLISQLFVNLVSNALKYHGDQKPEIEIGCNEETGKWIFYIKDNGIGIDIKFFDKIFIIFQRLHNKGEYSGTGIGLAICKKIVETHKGEIWVESETGKGSIFYFSIPKHIL